MTSPGAACSYLLTKGTHPCVRRPGGKGPLNGF